MNDLYWNRLGIDYSYDLVFGVSLGDVAQPVKDLGISHLGRKLPWQWNRMR